MGGYVADRIGNFNTIIISGFLCASFTLGLWLNTHHVGTILGLAVIYGTRMSHLYASNRPRLTQTRLLLRPYGFDNQLFVRPDIGHPRDWCSSRNAVGSARNPYFNRWSDWRSHPPAAVLSGYANLVWNDNVGWRCFVRSRSIYRVRA